MFYLALGLLLVSAQKDASSSTPVRAAHGKTLKPYICIGKSGYVVSGSLQRSAMVVLIHPALAAFHSFDPALAAFHPRTTNLTFQTSQTLLYGIR